MRIKGFFTLFYKVVVVGYLDDSFSIINNMIDTAIVF
jgi:hypothetical protein